VQEAINEWIAVWNCFCASQCIHSPSV